MRIKNWSKHQHFKDRSPPWIKLYRDILDDPDWHDLDGETAKVLVSLWLIASEDETHNGQLPDLRRLAFRLRIKESQLNQALTKLSHWLIQDDISVISGRYQDDAPETETETEKEKETDAPRKRGSVVDQPKDVLDTTWSDFLTHRKAKKAAVTETVVNQIRKEAEKAGIPLDDALQECCARGWLSFKADWHMPSVKTDKPMFAGLI
jgi:hypothetical protein